MKKLCATNTEIVIYYDIVKHDTLAGLDRLLAKSLDSVIRENLGDRTIQKIENRLFEKFGISLTQSIEQFEKLDTVLREFFGAGAEGLEQKFFNKVCEIKLIDGKKWMEIENPTLTRIILESFGDDNKKKILGILNGEPLITSQIVEACGIPQTSGYRKVSALISDGLLVPAGHIVTQDGKKVTKYKSIFENIKIDIVKNKISVTLQLCSDSINDSSIIAVCSK